MLPERFKQALVSQVQASIDRVGVDVLIEHAGHRAPGDAFIEAMREIDSTGVVASVFVSNRDEVCSIVNGMLGLM